MWREIYSIVNENNKLLHLCFVFKIIVWKDDVFLLVQQQIMNENIENVPWCTGWLKEMGLIVATIQHFSFVLQQPSFIGWD